LHYYSVIYITAAGQVFINSNAHLCDFSPRLAGFKMTGRKAHSFLRTSGLRKSAPQ